MFKSILETSFLIQKEFSLTMMTLQAFYFSVPSKIIHPGLSGCQLVLQHGVKLAKIIKQGLRKETAGTDDEWGDQEGMGVRKRFR